MNFLHNFPHDFLGTHSIHYNSDHESGEQPSLLADTPSTGESEG